MPIIAMLYAIMHAYNAHASSYAMHCQYAARYHGTVISEAKMLQCEISLPKICQQTYWPIGQLAIKFFALK